MATTLTLIRIKKHGSTRVRIANAGETIISVHPREFAAQIFGVSPRDRDRPHSDSVLQGRLLDVVDDNELRGSLGGFQF